MPMATSLFLFSFFQACSWRSSLGSNGVCACVCVCVLGHNQELCFSRGSMSGLCWLSFTLTVTGVEEVGWHLILHEVVGLLPSVLSELAWSSLVG